MRHLDAQMNVRADWEYAYDAAGNIVREYDRTRPEGSSFAFDQYTFDELNRLVAAVIQSPTFGEQLQQFDYDAFGNRTSSSIMNVVNWQGAKGASAASVTASALLDSPNRQVVNMAFTAGDPRLLKNQLPTFTAAGLATGADYDAQGNLKRIYQKPTTGTPVTIYLEYDAFGRVIQSTNGATGTVEKYHYSAEGLRILVEEYAGTTLAKTRINLYNDARQLVSQYEKPAAGAVAWKRDIFHLGTREAAEVDAAGMHVTQVDHLGSPRVITGPSGALEGTQKYLPFGELLEQSGTFKTAKGFTNHEQTEASGLIYMQARFYLPWYGRFASPDPALDQHFTESQSWNIYAYVRNNPVMSTDPTGMFDTPKDLDVQDTSAGKSPTSQAQGDGQQQGEKAADNGQKAEANPANNQKTGAQTGDDKGVKVFEVGHHSTHEGTGADVKALHASGSVGVDKNGVPVASIEASAANVSEARLFEIPLGAGYGIKVALSFEAFTGSVGVGAIPNIQKDPKTGKPRSSGWSGKVFALKGAIANATLSADVVRKGDRLIGAEGKLGLAKGLEVGKDKVSIQAGFGGGIRWPTWSGFIGAVQDIKSAIFR